MAKSSKKKLREAVARTKRMFKLFTNTRLCDDGLKRTYIHIEN